ncbi:MAG: hypothetical protein AB7Y46_16865 [Armatimonadota bacterium]
MVRPWLAALALLVCGLMWLTAYAWSVDFVPAEVLSGLGRAAAALRLEGIGIALHLQAAKLWRAQVHSVREGGSPADGQSARFALADELGAAALLARVEGGAPLAEELAAEAVRAAPERADLRCLLVELRCAKLPAPQRRMAILRLVHETDAACAHLLAGQCFLAAGDAEAAEAYLKRAVELRSDVVGANLLLAELALRRADREEAAARAAAAFGHAQSLRARLQALERLRRAGGDAPPRWRVAAQHIWEHYWPAGALGLAFVLFLVHPALIAAAMHAAARLRGQDKTAQSAS